MNTHTTVSSLTELENTVLTKLEKYGFNLIYKENTDHPWGPIRPSNLKNKISDFNKKRKYEVNWGIEDPKLEIPEGYVCIYIYLESENSNEFLRQKNYIIYEYGQRFYDCIQKMALKKRYILLDCSDEVQFHKIISFIHDSFKPW